MGNAKKDKKSSFTKKYMSFVFLGLLTIISLVLVKFDSFQKLNSRLYDFMLGKTKEIKTNEDIVIIDVDDDSLARVGSWPWTRDIFGDILIRMKEFGARQAVFDIEFISPASKGVSDDLQDKINNAFAEGEGQIASNVSAFSGEIARGSVNKGNALAKGEELSGNIDNVLYEMQRDITSDFNKDHDDYLARAVQFFNNVSLTVNVRDIGVKREQEDIDYVHNRFLFDNVEDKGNLFAKENLYSAKEEGEDVNIGFVPALNKIMTKGNCAGFPNVVVDRDGVRRRVELFNNHDGKFLGQLSFGPLMRLMDVQSIIRHKRSLELKGLKDLHSDKRFDITVPLDSRGRMIINWLHTDYVSSFRHIPTYVLYNLDKAEIYIQELLETISKSDLSMLSAEDAEYVQNVAYFIDGYKSVIGRKNKVLLKCRGYEEDGTPIKGGIKDTDYEKYFKAKNDYYAELKEFTDSFKTIGNSDKLKELGELASGVEHYLSDCELMRGMLDNSFCLIGNSATSSTDLGVTPFTKRYANLGTHANVINTVLEQDFITELNTTWVIVFSVILAGFIIYITKKKGASPGKKNAFGLIYVFLPTLLSITLMIFFKKYTPVVIPLALCLAVYFTEVVLNFRALNADKKFLQTKFGAYVSPDVVKEMQKNPELAELGAQNKYMTALFSDVQTFSGFTETLNNKFGEERGAVELQQVLSDYLGYLTKEIQGQKGTVDKFVGDEIVSFFNAPLDDDEHAFHGCVAGIRMLQSEARYNEEHMADLPINEKTGKPFLLHSRVGLNTGYMAVGNMGTSDKMNYTVMGNAVNLASRLEGTNKVYGSWIMVSDSTWQAADNGAHKGELIERKFDCVRVINVKKPVQIHNILGLRNELPKEQIEAAEIFNEGMNWYLKGSETPDVKKDIEDLKKAYEFFKKAKACYPLDASSEKFMERCEDFFANGLPDIWDGVYTMKTK